MVDDTAKNLEITEDRYKNRRKMAWLSFWLITVVGVPMLALGLFTENGASRIDAMSMFVGTIFGIWVAIITWYFGSTTVTDKAEIDR